MLSWFSALSLGPAASSNPTSWQNSGALLPHSLQLSDALTLPSKQNLPNSLWPGVLGQSIAHSVGSRKAQIPCSLPAWILPNLQRCGAGSATTLGPPESPVLTGANVLRAVSINYVGWGGLIGGLPPLGAKMPLSQTVPETARWPEALSAPGSPSVLWKGGRWKGSECRKVGKPWAVAFESSGRQLTSCTLV
jgi:hypothetical protein